MRASRIPGDSGGVGARIFFGHWRTRAEHTYAYARQPLSPTSSFASSPAHARTLAPRHPPTPSTASLATLTALSLLPLVQPFPVSCSFCRVTLTPPAPPIHRFAPRSPRHARPFLALSRRLGITHPSSTRRVTSSLTQTCQYNRNSRCRCNRPRCCRSSAPSRSLSRSPSAPSTCRCGPWCSWRSSSAGVPRSTMPAATSCSRSTRCSCASRSWIATLTSLVRVIAVIAAIVVA